MQPAASDEYTVTFPVLWVALEWVERHCVIPDGFHKREPYILSSWQAWYYANHYRIKSNAKLRGEPGLGAPAFWNRRSQIIMPQKAGKGPLTASQCCLEGVGPALFAGWAQGGEEYRCIDHGCPCGWIYTYLPGEAMGIPWPTPLIQLTAYSQEQTDNVYGALRPMIDEGPLSNIITKTGEEFIRLPGGGRIDTVTSSNLSRLGQRVTFVPQDEVGLWLPTNKMVKVAETQRRGASGMKGRVVETSNAYDPSEDSVAQRTYRASLTRRDIFRLHPMAPPGLSFKNKTERRRILRYVYAGCPWVDLDAINDEAEEILETDPAQAERFYGNRIVAGLGAWIDETAWDYWEVDEFVPDGTAVALGFDGSDTDDWTAIRLETRTGYRFTPTYGPNDRPCFWNPAEWGGSIPRTEVNAAVNEICTRFRVRRAYCDPYDWRTEIAEWALKHGGDEVFLEWSTGRIDQMWLALKRARNDLTSGRNKHDGDKVARDHILNARMAAKPGQKYILVKPDQHRKIDIAMADTLAHEAASDLHAIGEEAWKPRRTLTRAVGSARSY